MKTKFLTTAAVKSNVAKLTYRPPTGEVALKIPEGADEEVQRHLISLGELVVKEIDTGDDEHTLRGQIQIYDGSVSVCLNTNHRPLRPELRKRFSIRSNFLE